MIKVMVCFSCLILFFGYSAMAEEAIVVYRDDGSVSVIHPIAKAQRVGESASEFYRRVYQESTVGTDLDGRPYDIIDSSGLPSRDSRDAWQGKDGKGVLVNTIAAKKIKADKEVEKMIRQEERALIREEAVKRLKEKGIIKEEDE